MSAYISLNGILIKLSVLLRMEKTDGTLYSEKVRELEAELEAKVCGNV